MSLSFPHLFAQLPAPGAESASWPAALHAEMKAREGAGHSPRRPARSILVAAGGRLGEGDLAERLLEAVGNGVAGAGTEWTLELDAWTGVREPGAPGLSREVIQAWAGAGVTRVSLRSFHPSRGHPSMGGETPTVPASVVTGAAEWCAARAGELLAGGIPLVSADVPLGEGRGGPTGGHALTLAEALVKVGVQQLALHEEEGTEDPGGWLGVRGHLAEAGYESLDGIHFFRGEGPAVHPRAVLRREPILGLGPGAVTFRNPMRRGNVREWRRYRAITAGGSDPLRWQEHLTRAEVRTERVWCRLRGREGLRTRGLGAGARRRIEEWVARDLARMASGRVTLTQAGWLKADALAVDLLVAEELDRGGAPDPPSLTSGGLGRELE